MSDLKRATQTAFLVNGKDVVLPDRDPTARDLLLAAHMKPPSEHQLLAVGSRRTRFCPLDDPLPPGERHFRAFESGELSRFTLDEVEQVWGAEHADVAELLDIFGIDDDHELLLEREGEPDLVLTAEGEVQFGPEGVEDLLTRHRRRDKVLVSVLTTSGVFPPEGVERVEPDTTVSQVLARAARKLKIGDTGGWVVTSESHDVDPRRSFAENGLAGTVVLAWNAPEGGGGHA